MDRRKKRTSTAQYMMYIDMMEKDPIFATGRVPRDVDMNYLHERWKELSDKLNTCNSGPKLTAGEWRKRLNDWKNTTRCKYRRSLSSGDVSLTTLENKALHLFGKAPNVNNPTEELSIHLKSEKEEEIDEDDMDHQRTSEIFQKELQAAVEEAIGGDDDEEVMDEQEDQEGELLDPLPVETKNIAINNSSGGGGVGSGGGGAVGTAQTVDNSTTTTYRTIVVENAPYNEADEEEDIEYITAHRCRASTSSSANSNAVAHKATTTSNVTASGNVTKLINGDIPLKRLRTHAPEHIIYEVSSVKKVPSITQTHPPPQQQQQQQQHHHHQPQQQQQQQQQQSTPRILKTLHNTEAQQHYTEPHHSSTSTVSNAAVPSVLGSSADGRDIARQLKRIADIKAEKLKFEVARFKFNNPGFVFNLHPI